MMGLFSGPCPVCGEGTLVSEPVLWRELVDDWQLSDSEVEYINRQQGCHCKNCKNNLRSMALAEAILREYDFTGTMEALCSSDSRLCVLEVNRAGNLTPFLSNLAAHRLVEFPQFDLMNLELESASFDLVVHSDTLEHVPDPVRGLSECRRILKRGGVCIFTVPVVVDRMTRSRAGLAPSHHGQSGVDAKDQLVFTEFGVDVWKTVIKAGFRACEIFALEYPSALAIVARH